LLGLPKESVVLQISPDAAADEGLIKWCRDLRESGWVLALSDVVWPADASHPLVEMVDILKIDHKKTSSEDQAEQPARFASQPVKLLADNLETREEFRLARQRDYTFFQGGFFSRPELIPRGDLARYKLNYVKLLNELGRSQLDFPSFQKLIETNPPLVYKLLNYINSAFFGVTFRVSSVQQALLLLGEQEIRKWAALAIIHHLGQDHPQEVLRVSLMRARLGEIFAAQIGLGPQSSDLFLVGLLSLLDVYLGRPLSEVLSGMPLTPLIKETLLGSPNAFRQVLDLIVAIEQADWERVVTLAGHLGLKEPGGLASYLEAVDFVEQTMQSWAT
jgi:EAL and modified HD-GYP domain-containing signal transduction protein